MAKSKSISQTAVKVGKTAKTAKKQPKAGKSVTVAHVMTDDEQREAIMKPVNQWRSYIRRLLNEDDTYRRKYTHQVTLAAQSMRLLQECYIEICRLTDGRFTIKELSREGNSRLSENPLVLMYIRLDAMCRKNLAALGMNMSNLIEGSGKSDDSDPLRELMEKMR